MDCVNKEKVKKMNTRTMIYVGMFAALIAVISQCSIPMPSGVPATLQMFAIALIGVILGWKMGVASIVVFILLGAFGVPVFAGFSSGVRVLVGATGGFIWGYIPMVALCGTKMNQKKFAGMILGLAGLLICYFFGAVQFMVVMHMGFMESVLIACAPYLVKDLILVVVAFLVGKQIRKRLMKANLI